MIKRLIATMGLASTIAFGAQVTKSACEEKGDEYLFAGGECIEFAEHEGDTNEKIMLVIHGSWPAGTNTLGRYNTFAETLNMNTDITTIAVALPGYSGSSANKMPPLEHEAKISPAATTEYVKFLGELVKAFKDKYEANEVTYVGHSAGARMGATLSAMEPGLMTNVVLAGGQYETKLEFKGKAISFGDVMNKASKDTNYILIYGEKDKISTPKVSIDMYEKMKKTGLNVKLVEAKGAPHLDLDMTNASQEAISSLFE